MSIRSQLLHFGALLLATQVACHGPTTAEQAGCTQYNCSALLNSCSQELDDDLDDSCAKNTPPPYLLPDGGQPVPDSCVQVCKAAGSGLLLECLVPKCKASGPSAFDPAAFTACSAKLADAGTPPALSGKCETDCQRSRAKCQGACPLTSATACSECELACSLGAINCRWNCPAEVAHCTNGTKDGNETDVDCGGDCGPCDDAKQCKATSDCFSQHCTGNTCGPTPGCTRFSDCPNKACLWGQCY